MNLFFYFLRIIFVLVEPDPDTHPDPQHWFYSHLEQVRKLIQPERNLPEDGVNLFLGLLLELLVSLRVFLPCLAGFLPLLLLLDLLSNSLIIIILIVVHVVILQAKERLIKIQCQKIMGSKL